MVKEIIKNKINSALNLMIADGKVKKLSDYEREKVIDRFSSICESHGIKCNRKNVIVPELYNTQDCKIQCYYKRYNKVIVSVICLHSK